MQRCFPAWLAMTLVHLVVSGCAFAQSANAPPSCGGIDMLPEAKAHSPDARQRIDEGAASISNGQGVFWRIFKPGTEPSHLFGTIHLTDDRVNALPAPVTAALEKAAVVALEIDDLSPAKIGKAMQNLQSLLVYSDGRTLDGQLTPGELSAALQGLEEAGVTREVLGRLRPWFVTMSLALPSCERRRTASGLKSLDQRLGERARSRQIPVIGLETIEEQLRALAGLPDSQQIQLLKAGLRIHHRLDDQIETLVQRYLSRDLGLLWSFQVELWRQQGAPPAAVESFRRILLTNRNIRMRDAALPLLSKGRAFVAVGALHLTGRDGLVALFREAGYSVEPAE